MDLKEIDLFADMDEEGIRYLLHCSGAVFRDYEKEIFGILIHVGPDETYWYDAIAVTDCKVLCISWDFLFNFCPVSCEVHKSFIKNMIRVQADISVSQMKKLSILAGSTAYNSPWNVLQRQRSAWIPWQIWYEPVHARGLDPIEHRGQLKKELAGRFQCS